MGLFSNLFGGAKSACTFKKSEHAQGNRYDVYTGRNRAEAIAFLRGTEVKEERHYVIVETPEGNFGRDLIMIFDERTQALIELGERKPLTRPKKSRTHCSWCGYAVLPAGASIPGAREFVIMTSMKEKGMGFACGACGTTWCAFCVELSAGKVPCPGCKKGMEPLRE